MLLGTNSERVSRVLIISTLTILSVLGILAHSSVVGTSISTEVIGNQTDSKYLTITGHRYREGEFSDQITGVIVNNSTKPIDYAAIYVALYNENKEFITMETGNVAVTTLPPGENSAFSFDLFAVQGENVRYYTLFPGGVPTVQ